MSIGAAELIPGFKANWARVTMQQPVSTATMDPLMLAWDIFVPDEPNTVKTYTPDKEYGSQGPRQPRKRKHLCAYGFQPLSLHALSNRLNRPQSWIPISANKATFTEKWACVR